LRAAEGYLTENSSAAKAKDEAIVALLFELATLYWRPDFTPDQAKVVIRQYLEDLRDFAVKDIAHAIRTYRRNPESKFFPHPGALRGILETPPAWHTLGKAKWLADCRRESAAELAKKEASLLRLASPDGREGKNLTA
jgi:hypothetical protein